MKNNLRPGKCEVKQVASTLQVSDHAKYVTKSNHTNHVNLHYSISDLLSTISGTRQHLYDFLNSHFPSLIVSISRLYRTL